MTQFFKCLSRSAVSAQFALRHAIDFNVILNLLASLVKICSLNFNLKAFSDTTPFKFFKPTNRQHNATAPHPLHWSIRHLWPRTYYENLTASHWWPSHTITWHFHWRGPLASPTVAKCAGVGGGWNLRSDIHFEGGCQLTFVSNLPCPASSQHGVCVCVYNGAPEVRHISQVHVIVFYVSIVTEG